MFFRPQQPTTQQRNNLQLMLFPLRRIVYGARMHHPFVPLLVLLVALAGLAVHFGVLEQRPVWWGLLALAAGAAGAGAWAGGVDFARPQAGEADPDRPGRRAGADAPLARRAARPAARLPRRAGRRRRAVVGRPLQLLRLPRHRGAARLHAPARDRALLPRVEVRPGARLRGALHRHAARRGGALPRPLHHPRGARPAHQSTGRHPRPAAPQRRGEGPLHPAALERLHRGCRLLPRHSRQAVRRRSARSRLQPVAAVDADRRQHRQSRPRRQRHRHPPAHPPRPDSRGRDLPRHPVGVRRRGRPAVDALLLPPVRRFLRLVGRRFPAPHVALRRGRGGVLHAARPLPPGRRAAGRCNPAAHLPRLPSRRRRRRGRGGLVGRARGANPPPADVRLVRRRRACCSSARRRSGAGVAGTGWRSATTCSCTCRTRRSTPSA